MSTGFYGTSSHSLDSKNRFSVPVRFKEPLKGDTFILSKPLTGTKCLYLYSIEGWEEVVSRASAFATGEYLTQIQRVMYKSVVNVTMDTQGRITIPADFCEYASLKGKIYAFGAGNRGELWNVEQFEQIGNDVADKDGNLFDFSLIGN